MRPNPWIAILTMAAATLAAPPAYALDGCDGFKPCFEERPDLREIFDAAGVEGTFVLLDVETSYGVVHNFQRSSKRYPPGSTFKIVNGLIALTTGVARDENEVIPYGGQPQRFPQWERDMSMREAMGLSAVPIYQEIARRIGLDRMRDWVSWLGYGNGEIGTVVDRFWLDGPLAISAEEQALLLPYLVRDWPKSRWHGQRWEDTANGQDVGALLASKRSLDIVKAMILIEEKDGARLYGKTGWLFDATPQIGWWVGWVERGGKIKSFALNIDIKTPEDAKKRETLGRALLAKVGAW